MENIKPKIFISRCLGFANCRYDGQILKDQFIEKLKNYADIITECPEMETGLGVPRKAVRIADVNGKYCLFQPSTDIDITEKMNRFIKNYIENLGEMDGFILKNRSPTCGIADVKIYKGKDPSARSYRGNGFFGDAVKKYYPDAAVEDEGRLKNYLIREHFLIKAYTLCRFKKIKRKCLMKDLIDFQASHKLLFLSYRESSFRKCGSITANHRKLEDKEVFSLYEEKMNKILSSAPKYTAIINSLHHAFGWVSEGLASDEKKLFLDTVEEYRDERIPLSVLLHMLSSYAVRFKNNYLGGQYFLNPYPIELTSITDSGKGRDY